LQCSLLAIENRTPARPEPSELAPVSGSTRTLEIKLSDPRTGTSSSIDKNWIIFLILSIYLICTLMWRALTKIHVMPLSTEKFMTIGLDFLVVVGLIGVKTQISRGKLLFWIALIAGLGLFAIRLSNDSDWSSGHLFFTLCPRQGEAIVCRCVDEVVSWLCP
jgi:hypothetical protein